MYHFSSIIRAFYCAMRKTTFFAYKDFWPSKLKSVLSFPAQFYPFSQLALVLYSI